MYNHVVVSDAVRIIDDEQFNLIASEIKGFRLNAVDDKWVFAMSTSIESKDDLLDQDTKLFELMECVEDDAIVRSATFCGNDILLRKITMCGFDEPIVELL